jgi:hypothetical protein
MQAKKSILRQQEKLCDAHRERVCQRLPANWQERPEPQFQVGKGGRYPYPGLSNLGNTCYVSAVLYCLLHCEPARVYLRSMASDGQDETTRAFREQLGRLVVECCLGSSVEDCSTPVQIDVFSPHASMDIFLKTRVLGVRDMLWVNITTLARRWSLSIPSSGARST